MQQRLAYNSHHSFTKEIGMKANEGAADRLIRVAIALLMATLVAMKVVTGTAAIIAGSVGAVMLITGAVGICGLYTLAGLSTCKAPARR
jgi:hypothetical protein